MTYQSGRLVNVDLVRFGDELTAAAALGATSLTVDDVSDFDEDGGKLILNGAVYTYLDADDETGTLTLAAGIAAAADEGDSVEVYDEIYGVVATEKQAEVQFDVDDGNDDSVLATIAAHLVPLIPEGVRGNAGEHVLLELDGDEWRIIDVLGLADSMDVKFWADDRLTASGPGDKTYTLTYVPIDGSVHLRWNGLSQESSEFSVDGRNVTIPDPDGMLQAGDVLGFMYAYRDQPEPPEFDPILVAWASSGWSVLQVAATDVVDRSAAAFDHSAWAVVSFPISNSLAAHPDPTFIVPASTGWATSTALWVRRSGIAAQAGDPVVVSIRVDDYLGGVWWNGTQVAAPEPSDTPYGERVINVPGDVVTTTNVLAIKARDAAAGARTYVDVQIQEA